MKYTGVMSLLQGLMETRTRIKLLKRTDPDFFPDADKALIYINAWINDLKKVVNSEDA